MSCLLSALFYRRGDLHLLGKIEMKLFIYMQAFMLIIPRARVRRDQPRDQTPRVRGDQP